VERLIRIDHGKTCIGGERHDGALPETRDVLLVGVDHEPELDRGRIEERHRLPVPQETRDAREAAHSHTSGFSWSASSLASPPCSRQYDPSAISCATSSISRSS